MSDSNVHLGPLLIALLVIFTAAAALLVHLTLLTKGSEIVIAAVRATVQLAAVSLVIAWVLKSMLWTLVFVASMIVIAAGTSAGRVSRNYRPRAWWTLAPIALAVIPVVALILLSTAVPFKPLGVLPVAGIIIGGAMTVTSLTGKRATEELHARKGEYEAALSLGLTRRDAVHLVAKPAAALALLPILDQTRTVGLVTLPGAFVGVLLAGASPVQAGAAQLLVLISLLLVSSLASVITVELVAAGRIAGPDGPVPE
ncbi:ABC transporter permease [Nakamurella antarctica]|uniref:ABC transporter permease n=1 Tax=Nakamurella antarctica TaxID=1902245 RepID=A0A3G8ZL88_9ACTN|nr:ABC transporter permease [Nakamurella antarctica]AZI57595.1 ABC transporter permease [Nakamurella antarctica]